jgi:hypothetical protein
LLRACAPPRIPSLRRAARLPEGRGVSRGGPIPGPPVPRHGCGIFLALLYFPLYDRSGVNLAGTPFGEDAETPPVTDSTWYLARGKQKYGPYSTEQLRQFAAEGKIAPTDMLLQAGVQKWTLASSVQGLFPKEQGVGSTRSDLPPGIVLATGRATSSTSESVPTPALTRPVPSAHRPRTTLRLLFTGGLLVAGSVLCVTGGILFFFVFRPGGWLKGNSDHDNVPVVKRDEASKPDREMMRYLPSNSQLIFSIRPGPVAESEAFRRLPELRKLETKFEETTGLPTSQLTRVMFGGSAGSHPDATEFVGVCRTKNPVIVADILANMKDSNYREEKAGKYTIYKNDKHAFCVAEKDLVLFGPPRTIRETLLREGPPELSSGLQTAIGEADFSKGVMYVANAKDILRKDSFLQNEGAAGWSQELTDAMIRANAVMVVEMTFSKAIEWRMKICCKDAASAKELKSLKDEAIAKVKADPNTSRPVLKRLASERWSLDSSRLIGTQKIDVDTLVELAEQNNQVPKVPQGMSLKAYRAQRPAKPTRITGDCELSNMYHRAYRETADTHYSVMITQRDEIAYGAAWVPKESEAGRKIFGILKDGKSHHLTLEVVLQGPDGTPTPAGNEEMAIVSVIR